MSYYIGIEDLAANALIAVLNNSGKRFLSYTEIELYGAKVMEVLYKSGEKAVLILSRDSTNALFRNYSDYFEECVECGQKGIRLKEDKTADDLIKRFRGYLSLQLLKAFIDERSVSVLEDIA